MVLNQPPAKERAIKRVVHRSYSDDSSSCNTTISVGAASCKPASESCDGSSDSTTPRRKSVTIKTAAAINDAIRRMVPAQRRKVRFSETVRIRTLEGLPPDVTTAELYWTVHDFNTIRISAKLDTRNLRTHAKEGIQHINGAFASAFAVAQTHALSNHSDATGQPLPCLVEPEHVSVVGLSMTWSSNPLCGRGLERYVSNQHRQDRAEYGKGVRTLLLNEAKQQQHSPDTLAQLYHDASLPGAIFARTMGEADARAVHAINSGSVAEADGMTTEQTTPTPSVQQQDEPQKPRRSRPLLNRQKSFEAPPLSRMGSNSKLVRDNSRRNMLATNCLMRREGSERKIVLTA
jgi:hypothetical protein